MPIRLRVLILEDNPADAELMLHELRRAGFAPDCQRVETETDFLSALERGPELILSDYSLPQFDGLRALQLFQEHGADIPFIIVSGNIGEDLAVAAMKQGAADYLLKDRLARLGQAVTQALERKRLREKKRRAEETLRAKDEEIRAMTQQLWQTAKLATMGELAASVAHELNNPLAIVSLRVESLLDDLVADDPKRRALEVIAHEVGRMGRLVASLLQFSRRATLQISTLDVSEEIERTLELIHYHLRKCRVTVERACAPDLPLIRADRQQLRQLFLNLFTNASDAMPSGGTLTLRVYQQAKGSQGLGDAESRGHGEIAPRPPVAVSPAQVVIEVADTGVGIAPEDLPRVMESFFTTKPEGKGTGLGLAICRRIVQDHGGTLDIRSEVGRGTTVRLVLPVANAGNALQ